MSNTQNVAANLIEQAEIIHVKLNSDFSVADTKNIDMGSIPTTEDIEPIQKTDEQLNADIDNLSAGISAVAVKNETADEPLVVEMIKENNKIDIHIGTSHIKNPG